MMRAHLTSVFQLVLVGAAAVGAQPAGVPWKRHTIDAGSVGADGVRTADINSDGLIDLTTGWEEAGEVRVYLNPGPALARQPWPMSIVGRIPSVEDALFADLNGDGRWDVVASCEGSQRSVHTFLATSDNPLDTNCWQGAIFSATANQQQWMFAHPLQVDGAEGVDLILGSKGTHASVSWLQCPTARTVNETWEAWCARWKLHRLSEAGWIMSLRIRDVDGDGDPDIVFSDRRGAQTGLWWLENLGVVNPTNSDPTNSDPHLGPVFQRQAIGGLGQEVMFMDLADLDGDGLEDVVSAVSGGSIIIAYRKASDGVQWQETALSMPAGVGTGKAAVVTDVDLDGQMDIVITCENARNVSGVFWMRQSVAGTWEAQDISGAMEGIKFDRIELLDLDSDGDLDLITCEERDNLGVIWYENPTRSSNSQRK
jgi:hypothetical protein